MVTVLALLRRQANSTSLTGPFEIRARDGRQTNQYNYRVERKWGEDPEPDVHVWNEPDIVILQSTGSGRDEAN